MPPYSNFVVSDVPLPSANWTQITGMGVNILQVWDTRGCLGGAAGVDHSGVGREAGVERSGAGGRQQVFSEGAADPYLTVLPLTHSLTADPYLTVLPSRSPWPSSRSPSSTRSQRPIIWG